MRGSVDVAEAKVAGIAFKVQKPGGGGAASKGSSEGDYEITVGNVKIALGPAQDGRRTLAVDGKGYGHVSAGDTVEVDESRQVKVNGQPRSSQ